MALEDIRKAGNEIKKAKEEVLGIFQEIKILRKEIFDIFLGIERRRDRRNFIISMLDDRMKERKSRILSNI
jgi:hypothetical protein